MSYLIEFMMKNGYGGSVAQNITFVLNQNSLE